jgi:hypothetical protein
MKLLGTVGLEDLRHLNRQLRGQLYEELQRLLRDGREPVLTVSRESHADGFMLPRWTLTVSSGEPGDDPPKEFELTDVRSICVLSGILLHDLRAELLDEARLRLEVERARS